MRKPVVCLLVALFLFNTFAYALPYNEYKLLNMRPLLSDRLKTKALEGQKSKLWPAIISALLGAAVIATNQNQSTFASTEDQRLNNLEFGWLFLTLGASIYLTKTTPEYNPSLLSDNTDSGIEREKFAYLIYKNNATDAKQNREAASFIWTVWGLGIALLPLLAPHATTEYRTTVTATGLIFAGLGLSQHYCLSEPEKEIRQIDAELAK